MEIEQWLRAKCLGCGNASILLTITSDEDEQGQIVDSGATVKCHSCGLFGGGVNASEAWRNMRGFYLRKKKEAEDVCASKKLEQVRSTLRSYGYVQDIDIINAILGIVE